MFASDDEGVTWSELVVDELELGTECTSRSCYGDFYDSGPSLVADQDGDLGDRLQRGEHALRTPDRLRPLLDGRRPHVERPRHAAREDGVNAAFPAAVGDGNDGARVWFMAQTQPPVAGLVPDDRRPGGDLEHPREALGRDVGHRVTSTRPGSTRRTGTTARSRSPATATRSASGARG